MNSILIVLIVYLALMFLVAWYFSRREGVEAYFVNSRKTGVWLMAISSVATMIGAGATIAIVSETYNTGISYGIALPFGLMVGVLLLALISKKIKKIGDEYGAYTLVDFFHKRFDEKNKILVFIFQIFLMILWASVQIVAIASLASVLVGFSFTTALFLAALVTIFYTSIGGLKIDFITDFIQFWVILFVFIIMVVLGYNHIGSFGNLLSSVPQGHLNPFAFGGVVWFLGAVFLGGLLYLGDSATWQRIVSTKSQRTARRAFILALPIFILVGLIIVFFGLLASVKLSGIDQDLALFELMKSILPSWLIGVGLAAILAIIMSTVDSVLIGGSTILYRGLFKKNQFKTKKELLYARLITALFGIAAFSVVFFIPHIVSLSLLASYTAGMFAIAILFALYTKVSANANFYALLLSMIALFTCFPLMGPNSFVPPLITIVAVLIFYDKIFKKKTPTPLQIIGFEE